MTVLELLAKQAAEQRELSRDRGVLATEAKPAVEKAAADMGGTRKQIEEAEARLADLRAAHDKATDRHAEALAAMAAHEAEAQQAADIAESLERIAAQMREQRPTPPHEALAATGLMHEPPKVVATDEAPFACPSCGMGVFSDDDATWLHAHSGEAECDPDSPFNVVRAPDEVIAAVTGALPAGQIVATGPPDMTMPDLGPARPPLDPPPGDGTHSHAKPADGLMSRVTGGFMALISRDEEQDGGDRG